jgi:DNA modification methylase/ParB-like chromosome segregation protein Spo0J
MIRNIPIDEIKVSRGRRKPRDVEGLAESIREVGLLNPITVGKDYRLIAGGNRIAAFRLLGRDKIPAHVIDLDELDAELAEIDENLIRNELTVLERGKQHARRKEIYETKHPETKHGGDRKSEGARSNGGARRLKSFAEDAAEKTGVAPRTVREEVQIFKKISEDAKELIENTELEDKKTELLSLTRVPGDKQEAVVKAIVNGEAKTVAQAVRAVGREEKRVAMAEKAAKVGKPSDSWRVVQGDCREEMGRMDAGSVRLIFADPPYNIGKKYGKHYDDNLSPEKYGELCTGMFEAAHRALAPDGSLWLLISHEWSARLQIAAEAAGFRWRQTITWYETFGENQGRMFNLCSRPLLWLVKDPRRFVFNDFLEDIRRLSDRQAKYKDGRADPGGKLWDDVWGVKPPIERLVDNSKERLPGFPTQLPLALLRPIVACASDPGDLVLDPFSGSGTTGAACIELGRRFIGIELGPEFAALSRLRLAGIG